MVTAIVQDCLNVLLIEDNPGDAHLVMDMLSSSRTAVFKVTHVGVARKAIQCLKEGEYHAVLLDLSLPDTYGIETIFSILEAAPEISVVVLSGLANEKMAIQALQHGVQEYLIKGQIDASQLERALICGIERNRTTGKIRKQVRELERVIAKLAELDRFKNEFIALVSHELRTPLIVAQWGLGRLEREQAGTLNADQKEQVNILRRKMGSLNLFVNDLLNLNCIQSGRVQLKSANVPLQYIVQEAISFLEPLWAEKQCSIQIEPFEGADRVCCDPESVESVLINLISNSILHNEKSVSVHIGARAEKGRVFIYVRDNGKGVTAAERQNLYAPSLVTDESGRSRVKGLGLVFSKALVEAHGGSLVLQEPDPGQNNGSGIRFVFDLPEAHDHEAAKVN